MLRIFFKKSNISFHRYNKLGDLCETDTGTNGVRLLRKDLQLGSTDLFLLLLITYTIIQLCMLLFEFTKSSVLSLLSVKLMKGSFRFFLR